MFTTTLKWGDGSKFLILIRLITRFRLTYFAQRTYFQEKKCLCTIERDLQQSNFSYRNRMNALKVSRKLPSLFPVIQRVVLLPHVYSHQHLVSLRSRRRLTVLPQNIPHQQLKVRKSPPMLNLTNPTYFKHSLVLFKIAAHSGGYHPMRRELQMQLGCSASPMLENIVNWKIQNRC